MLTWQDLFHLNIAIGTLFLPPRTRPRMMPWRRPGRRRSRTAAARVSGRNSVPIAMFRWNRSCQVSMVDRPKNAPAAIEPAWPSHSRAARYVA